MAASTEFPTDAAPPAFSAAPPPASRVPWWVWVLLIALPLPIYLWALPFGLLGIDESVYFFSPLLDQGRIDGLARIWTQRWFDDYSPIAMLTLWVDRACGDGIHFHSARIQAVLWHGVAVAAVFALMRRMAGVRTGLAIAVLYGVHPLCGDAVLWLAERKNLVALALSYWCLERYVAWRQDGGPGRAGAAFALGGAALLAKPHAVALPVMMFAWECTLARESWTRAGCLVRLRALALPVAVTALYTAAQLHLRQDIGHSDAELIGGGRLAALWCDGDIIARYLLHVVWPVDLTLYYPVIEDPGRVSRLAAAWLVVATVMWATFGLARRRRLVACGWMMALGALLPALNLIAQAVAMTDYYVQWALPGLLLVIVTVVVDVAHRASEPSSAPDAIVLRLHPGWAWPALALAAVALGATAYARVGDFASADALYRSAYAKQPESAMNMAGFATVIAHGTASERTLAGQIALAAVRRPDHRRILVATVIDATILAGDTCWRTEGGRGPALKLVQEVSPGSGPDCALYVWSRILLGIGTPEAIAEADADLSHALGAEFIVAADAFGARCADGTVLPDRVPPVLTLNAPAGQSDGFWVGLARQDHLRLAVALGDVRNAQHRNQESFALIALCLNLDPQDQEARIALAALYLTNGHPAAALTLSGR